MIFLRVWLSTRSNCFFWYLTQHVMSEKDLLSRIYHFDYGFLKQTTTTKKHPTKIILEHAGNGIGLNSIQTLCREKHPTVVWWHDSCRKQKVSFVTVQIMNIVFSPSLTLGMTIYLKHLIVDHHKLFKHLYPHRNLIPKHHFLIHYPSSIRKIGPLLHVWCM